MTDIVERLEQLATVQSGYGQASSARITREAINEITRLRSQLSLQKEKLPDIPLTSRTNGSGVGDWRNLPEAP
ncbi:MAG TPA: hypothetical protein VLT57_02805 [Bryobacteraceae bacterium]|nr:hypothetical protein [Bryobacteraceae bacterium]